ncbi:hypothetical protein [Pseudomonas sp. BN411]|uniref:hypothetical protein n=1 Tax=Pseudomonas sp. BN411 TaxID=2567887 RepID=UPI002453B64A|nr:hypothetical protein [Pseudomonas sp. BN411]MDH4562156.1 hypothetical protein [Pseudomonas sp. BN411]
MALMVLYCQNKTCPSPRMLARRRDKKFCCHNCLMQSRREQEREARLAEEQSVLEKFQAEQTNPQPTQG